MSCRDSYINQKKSSGIRRDCSDEAKHDTIKQEQKLKVIKAPKFSDRIRSSKFKSSHHKYVEDYPDYQKNKCGFQIQPQHNDSS